MYIVDSYLVVAYNVVRHNKYDNIPTHHATLVGTVDVAVLRLSSKRVRRSTTSILDVLRTASRPGPRTAEHDHNNGRHTPTDALVDSINERLPAIDVLATRLRTRPVRNHRRILAACSRPGILAACSRHILAACSRPDNLLATCSSSVNIYIRSTA